VVIVFLDEEDGGRDYTTQVSQFELVLEKNGENWKIVKISQNLESNISPYAS